MMSLYALKISESLRGSVRSRMHRCRKTCLSERISAIQSGRASRKMESDRLRHSKWMN